MGEILDITKSKDYDCPNCGQQHNDSDYGYIVNSIEYPKRLNERKGYTLDGNYWDWDEVHCCEECGTKYWFESGIY